MIGGWGKVTAWTIRHSVVRETPSIRAAVTAGGLVALGVLAASARPALAQAPPAAKATAARPTAAPPATRSLYDRLGGAYTIATVVDDFIERLLMNDTLNANPAIPEARQRVPKAGLKFHVTTLVCQATGGPCKYVGRDMKTTHAPLNIRDKEWDAMVVDFRKTLDKFKVPAAEQGELITIVGSTKPDIVVSDK
jgi:hemoglobin